MSCQRQFARLLCHTLRPLNIFIGVAPPDHSFPMRYPDTMGHSYMLLTTEHSGPSSPFLRCLPGRSSEARHWNCFTWDGNVGAQA
jgi:hypothetical protein